MSDGNGWDEYRKLVMTEIQRLADEIRQERADARESQRRFVSQLTGVERELAVLKVKCGIWGLMGGLIPAVSALVMSKL